ncbi:MAG: DUF86 domain-containing protein [bacterium]
MIDQERIEERLIKLKEYLKILKSYQKYSFKIYKENEMLRAAVERYFQLAVEAMIDIGEIIISNLELRKAEDSRDVIDILGEAKVVPDKFAYYFGPVASFRNILVHDYLEINNEEVYSHLQKDLGDFDKFAKYIAKFLLKH